MDTLVPCVSVAHPRGEWRGGRTIPHLRCEYAVARATASTSENYELLFPSSNSCSLMADDPEFVCAAHRKHQRIVSKTRRSNTNIHGCSTVEVPSVGRVTSLPWCFYASATFGSRRMNL
jgi:hypothetical protein